MDPALARGVRDVAADAAPPRPHVLLRHAPAAGRAASRHARALRLRPHRRPDRRRPAPPGRRPTTAARRWTRGRRSSRRASTSRQPIVRALADAAARHRLPLGELRTYMRSMRIDCAPVRIAQLGGARGLHGRLGRLGRADHGRAARRAGAPSRATSAASGIAFQLANFIRDVREDRAAGPRLPARRGPRALRRQRGRPAARRASPEVRALLAHEVERARGLFAAAAPGDRRRAAPPCARASAFAIGLYGRMLDRVEATGFDVLGRTRRRARVAPPRRRAGGAAVRRRATLRGAERTPLDDARRRADLRRELRRASPSRASWPARGADVLVVDRYEIGERATSALRRADAVAARDGRRARDPPGDPVHGVPHAARLGPLPAALELVELRLPRALPRAVGADRRPLRDRQGEARDGTPSTPTAATLTAPLIVDALGWRRVLGPGANVQPPEAAISPRPRGPPARRRHRPRRLDRPQPDPLRLRLVGPGGRRAARRRRLLRAARPRQGADEGDRRGASTRDAVRYQGNWFPHRLRPADRGRRVLRRRQRRALPAALGRGHPHRVLLRDRRRPGAPRACSPATDAASRRSTRYGAFSRRHAPAFAYALALQRADPAAAAARPDGAAAA